MASAPGVGFFPAQLTSPIPIVVGATYILGVGWSCPVGFFLDDGFAYVGTDGGIGVIDVLYLDDAYPGPNDNYVPPIPLPDFVMHQRLTFAE